MNAMIPGLQYLREYLNEEREHALMEIIDQQPWLTDLRRRVQHYGYRYDYKARQVASPPGTTCTSGPHMAREVFGTESANTFAITQKNRTTTSTTSGRR